MDRIPSDPGLETCPSFAAAFFDATRAALVAQHNITDGQATQQLREAWTQDNEARKAAWALQVEQDRIAQEQAHRLQIEEEEQRRRQVELDLQAERAEADRKRPKMNDFDDHISGAAPII